jgi:hypothetical protein
MNLLGIQPEGISDRGRGLGAWYNPADWFRKGPPEALVSNIERWPEWTAEVDRLSAAAAALQRAAADAAAIYGEAPAAVVAALRANNAAVVRVRTSWSAARDAFRSAAKQAFESGAISKDQFDSLKPSGLAALPLIAAAVAVAIAGIVAGAVIGYRWVNASHAVEIAEADAVAAQAAAALDAWKRSAVALPTPPGSVVIPGAGPWSNPVYAPPIVPDSPRSTPSLPALPPIPRAPSSSRASSAGSVAVSLIPILAIAALAYVAMRRRSR